MKKLNLKKYGVVELTNEETINTEGGTAPLGSLFQQGVCVATTKVASGLSWDILIESMMDHIN